MVVSEERARAMGFDSALGSLIGSEASFDEALELFRSTDSPRRGLALFSAASDLRDKRLGRELRLFGNLGFPSMMTGCPLNPPCLYCSNSSNDSEVVNGRRAISIGSIKESIKLMESCGMDAVHLIGGTCLEGLDGRVMEVVSAIREDSDIPLEVNVGPSLSVDTIRWLKAQGTFRVVCSLETLNSTAFAEAKPADSLAKRIKFMEMLEMEGMPMKSIVMNGLGSSEDLIKSIVYMRRFKNLTALWITTFTPIRGTPWAERQPASVWDSLKAMSITRLLLPDADVNLGFGGGGNLMPTILMAGGGNIFMSLMKDHGIQTDNRASITSCASSLGFNVRLEAA